MRRQIVALLLLALAPALLAAFFHPRRPSWRTDEITVAVAQSWKDALWLDARPRDAFEHAHVPGALLLNEDEWNDLLPAVLDAWNPDRNVVVYCSSLSCQASRDVARRLREEAQFSRVFVLQGGWEAWEKTHR